MCKSCKKAYSTPNKLKQHLNNVVVNVKYYCPPCHGFFDEDHPCDLREDRERCAHCKEILEANNFRGHLCFHIRADKEKFCNYCQTEVNELAKSSHLCQERVTIMDNVKKNNIECIDEDRYLCKVCENKFTLSEVFLHLYKCLQNNYQHVVDLTKPSKKKSKKCAAIEARRSEIQCECCQMDFDTAEDLLTHCKAITPRLIYFCTHCVSFFDQEVEHPPTCSVVPQILIAYCVVCKRSIDKLKYMEHACFHVSSEETKAECHKTILTDYKNFLYLCDICGKPIPSNVKGDHFTCFHKEKLKPKSGVITCTLCGTRFQDPVEYRKHKRLYHNNVLCHICGKNMTTGAIKHHMNAHFNNKNFKCKECDKALTTKTQLQRHMLVHSNEAKYKCETCGKCFKNNFNRKVHMRIHADVKPFECLICKKTFTTKQWRDNHLKTHNVLDAT